MYEYIVAKILLYRYSCSSTAVATRAKPGVMPDWSSQVVKYPSTVVRYRVLRLNYTTDLSCGLKFKHTVGYEICTVGLKFSINVSTLLYYVQYSTGTVQYGTRTVLYSCTGTGTVLYGTVRSL